MSDVHLSRAELEEWRDRGAGDRAQIVTHLAACVPCRALAADVERHRAVEAATRFDAHDFVQAGYRAGTGPPRSMKPLRQWMWPAAAAAVVVLALVPLWLTRFDQSPEVMRGGAATLVLVQPSNVSVSPGDLAFEWRGTSAADRVRLNVIDLDRADAPLIDRDVSGSRYEPTSEERSRFRSGQSVHWYIQVGSETSPAASFRVR